MPQPAAIRVTKPLLPNTISQACAAMTSGTTSVVKGRRATKVLPGNENRAVKKAKGAPMSVAVSVTARPRPIVLTIASRYFASPNSCDQPELPLPPPIKLARSVLSNGYSKKTTKTHNTSAVSKNQMSRRAPFMRAPHTARQCQSTKSPARLPQIRYRSGLAPRSSEPQRVRRDIVCGSPHTVCAAR